MMMDDIAPLFLVQQTSFALLAHNVPTMRMYLGRKNRSREMTSEAGCSSTFFACHRPHSNERHHYKTTTLPWRPLLLGLMLDVSARLAAAPPALVAS